MWARGGIGGSSGSGRRGGADWNVVRSVSVVVLSAFVHVTYLAAAEDLGWSIGLRAVVV